jgi:hypothetical protein
MYDGAAGPVFIVKMRLTRIESGRIEGLKFFEIIKRIVTNLFHFCPNESQSPRNTPYFLPVSYFNAGSLGAEIRLVSEGSGYK